MIQIYLKQCTKCGEMKEMTKEFFYKDFRYRDGFRGHCKECIKKDASNWNREHPEEHKKYHKKWLEENLEVWKEYKKDWYKAHPNYKKDYYLKNKEKLLEYNRERNKKIREKIGCGYDALHQYVKKHKPKPKLCEVCNKELVESIHCKNHDYMRNLNNWLYVCKGCHIELNRLL